MSLKDKYKKKLDVEDYKRTVQEDEQASYSGGSNNTFLKINDGKNFFRIFPTENPSRYAFPRKVSWLYIASEKKGGDFVRITVPNAITHGRLKKDPIEEYIKYVLNTRIPEMKADGETKAAKLVEDVFKDYKKTPAPKVTFIAYAYQLKSQKSSTDEGIFGLLEMKPSVKDGLSKVFEDLIEDEGEPLSSNVISDPEDGRVVKITYDSKAKTSSDYYSVSLTSSLLELEDSDLELLEQHESLETLYGPNSYSKKDFDLAIDALAGFEEFHKIPDFSQEDDFLDILSSIAEELEAKQGSAKSSKKDRKEDPKKSAPVSKKRKIDEDEDEDDEEEDDEEDEAPKRKVISKPGKAKAKVEVEDEDEEEDDDEEDEDEKPLSKRELILKKAKEEVAKKKLTKSSPITKKKGRHEEEDDEDEEEDDDDEEYMSLAALKKRANK